MDEKPLNAPDKTNSGYEKSDVSSTKLFIAAFVILFLIVILVIFVNDMFVASKDKLVEDIVLSKPSAELRELHAREEKVLQNYKILDADHGVIQIPIDRAMGLLADEAFREKLKLKRK